MYKKLQQYETNRKKKSIDEYSVEAKRDLDDTLTTQFDETAAPFDAQTEAIKSELREIKRQEALDVNQAQRDVPQDTFDVNAERDLAQQQIAATEYDRSRDLLMRGDLVEMPGMQQTSIASRAASYKPYQDYITEQYKIVRKELDKYEVEVAPTVAAKTQKLEYAGNKTIEDYVREYDKLNPQQGVLPKGEGIKTPVTGFKSPELVEMYDRAKLRLKKASAGGDDGATMLIEIMEDLPDTISGNQALQYIQELNNVGWYNADVAVISMKQGIARQAAQQFNKVLDDAIKKLPAEAQATINEARKKAKHTLIVRDSKFNTEVGLTAQRHMETTGDIYALTDRPVQFESWWRSAGDGLKLPDGSPNLTVTQRLGKRQIISRLLDGDFDAFASRWKEMNITVKREAFTPAQIQATNRVVARGESNLNQVLTEYATKQQQFITNAAKRSDNQLIRKQKIDSLTDQRDKVDIQLKRVAADKQATLQTRRRQLDDEIRTMQNQLDIELQQVEMFMATKTLAAQKIIRRREALHRYGRYVAIGAGMWRAGNITEGTMGLMGW